jgi:hypothetical protein
MLSQVNVYLEHGPTLTLAALYLVITKLVRRCAPADYSANLALLSIHSRESSALNSVWQTSSYGVMCVNLSLLQR